MSSEIAQLHHREDLRINPLPDSRFVRLANQGRARVLGLKIAASTLALSSAVGCGLVLGIQYEHPENDEPTGTGTGSNEANNASNTSEATTDSPFPLCEGEPGEANCACLEGEKCNDLLECVEVNEVQFCTAQKYTGDTECLDKIGKKDGCPCTADGSCEIPLHCMEIDEVPRCKSQKQSGANPSTM